MSADPSPETVAQAFFDALEGGEWHRAAEFMHPQTIAGIRRDAERAAAECARGPAEITVEEVLRGSPGMPLEVAEYNARRFAESMAQEAPALQGLFAGVSDASELAALSETELYARRMEAADPRYQLRLAYTQAGRAMPAPVRDGHAAGIRRTALGAVREGPAMAHVVYRLTWFDPDLEAPLRPLDVLTLLWTGEDGWRLRTFDFSGHGRGRWVTYGVPDEDEERVP